MFSEDMEKGSRFTHLRCSRVERSFIGVIARLMMLSGLSRDCYWFVAMYLLAMRHPFFYEMDQNPASGTMEHTRDDTLLQVSKSKYTHITTNTDQAPSNPEAALDITSSISEQCPYTPENVPLDL